MHAPSVPIEAVQLLVALAFVVVFVAIAVYYGTEREWPPDE